MPSSLLDDLLADRFAKLAGLHVTGTLPLQQELVNEVLAQLVQGWSEPRQSKPGGVPVSSLLALVRKLEVRSEPGVIHVDFELGA